MASAQSDPQTRAKAYGESNAVLFAKLRERSESMHVQKATHPEVVVTVNGRAERLDPSLTLLAALTKIGVHVPHLCHDSRLAPAGACRLCLVEVDGKSQPVIACTERVVPNMVVRTESPALMTARRGVLRFLAHRYPPLGLDEPDNTFVRELMAHGLEPEGKELQRPRPDETHPYIRVDLARCIHCDRCERICRDVQGQNTWSVSGRGGSAHMVPDSGTTLRASSCVSCGACVDSCPSGALQDRSVLRSGPAEAWTRSVCAYCGVGCELQVGTRAGRIVQIRPALDAPANKGHLCVKGRYAFGFVEAHDRIKRPLLREGERWREVSFEEAVAFAAARLTAIRDLHGPDAIGVLGSARATNEESYLTQKFARVVLGTHNVDCCARVCHAPSAAALGAMLGTGAATSCFDDIEQARTIFVTGSNTTENHPVAGARIRQAARHGANLVVIDPRAIALTEEATLHLAPRPGTNIPLLHAMARVMLHEGLCDADFLAAHVEGLDALRDAVEPWTLERAAEVCDVAPELIERAARLYARGPTLSFHGLGLTEHLQGTEAVMALTNLALLTGNIGRPGSGVNPLRGQNNVQGCAHMGCAPSQLTGGVPIEQARASFERIWGAPLPSTPGLSWMQMLDAASQGALKALYVIGYDVLLSNPDAEQTRRALSGLDLLIVQDMFMTETAREFAHVVLPVACAFEKEGTFMSSERRVQRVRKAIEPPPGLPTDAQLISALASALGHPQGFTHATAAEIWDEVREVWPAGRGMTYTRLEQPGGLQWPCPDEHHLGSERLHEEGFGSGRKAQLKPVPYLPSPECEDAQYPYVLVTGRLLYQFNAGTMTGRTPNLDLQATDVLRISPGDAAREGLDHGQVVRVQSRRGSAELALEIDPAQRPGELFSTFHDPHVFINRLTSSVRDRIAATPEYKRTAVRLEPASRAAAPRSAPA